MLVLQWCKSLVFPEPQTGQRFFILWLLCKITTQDREKRPPCSQQLHCTRPRDREASRQRHIAHTNSTKRRPQSDNRSPQQQSSMPHNNLGSHSKLPKTAAKTKQDPKKQEKSLQTSIAFFLLQKTPPKICKNSAKILQNLAAIFLQYFCKKTTFVNPPSVALRIS